MLCFGLFSVNGAPLFLLVCVYAGLETNRRFLLVARGRRVNEFRQCGKVRLVSASGDFLWSIRVAGRVVLGNPFVGHDDVVDGTANDRVKCRFLVCRFVRQGAISYLVMVLVIIGVDGRTYICLRLCVICVDNLFLFRMFVFGIRADRATS